MHKKQLKSFRSQCKCFRQDKCMETGILDYLKIYSLVGNIKNDLVKYFMQHNRNGLINDSINS